MIKKHARRAGGDDTSAPAPQQAPERDPSMDVQDSAGNQAVQGVMDTGPVQEEPTLLPEDPMSLVAARHPDWSLFVLSLSTVPQAERQECIKDIRGQQRWEEMLAALGPQDMAEVTSWLAEDVGDDTEQSVEERIEGAANSERAKVALSSIDKLAANDPEGRLVGRIRELLALGVALPRSTRSPLGSEGVLSIASAERAAMALLAMPLAEYLRVALLLELSGDESRLQQSFVLLEAVAARAESGEFSELESFSDDIRGMDDATLHDQTSVIQTDTRDRSALEHKFKRNSGVGAVQTVAAEADPILALRMNQESGLDKDATESQTANEQEAAIERHTPKDAVARQTDEVKAYTLSVLRSCGVRGPEAEAVQAYFEGEDYDADAFDAAVTRLERGMGRSFPGKDALRQVREAAGAGRRGGLNAEELAAESNAGLGADGQEVEAQVDEELVADFGEEEREMSSENMDEWRPRMEAMLNRARPDVFRGQDVVFEIRWEHGGTDYMTFTNVDPRGSRFLVHNTSNGKSAWIDKSALLDGDFSRVGRGRGVITGLVS